MDATPVTGAQPRTMPVNASATSTTGTTTGSAIPKEAIYATFQVVATDTCTVIIEASNISATSTLWVTLGTITLAATGTDGFATASAWRWVRARVTANTGTVTVYMGV